MVPNKEAACDKKRGSMFAISLSQAGLRCISDLPPCGEGVLGVLRERNPLRR